MEEKARFTVVTKILGIFMLFMGLMGLIALKDAERVARSAWQAVYMSSIIFGGLCNLLDFGKSSFSILACVAYTVSAFSGVIIAFIVQGGAIYFVLWITALSISILRFRSVSKATQNEEFSQAPVSAGIDREPCMVDNSQSKCRVGIMRESRFSGSGSVFSVYVDGVKTTTIKDGATTRLVLTPGRHTLGFGVIGSKIERSIMLDLEPGSDTNVMCRTTMTGIEADLTTVDVCSLAGSTPPNQAQSDGGGCLPVIGGLILLLIGLYILGVKLRFFVFIAPIN